MSFSLIAAKHSDDRHTIDILHAYPTKPCRNDPGEIPESNAHPSAYVAFPRKSFHGCRFEAKFVAGIFSAPARIDFNRLSSTLGDEQYMKIHATGKVPGAR